MEQFEKGEHRIYHGDVLEVLEKAVPDESVDLLFLDPPYNIGKKFNGKRYSQKPDAYLEWCYQWLDLCVAKLAPTGTLYAMTSTQFMPYIDLFLRERLEIRSRIVWFYDSSGVQARTLFGSRYEPILHCVKDKSQYTFNAEDILVEARTGAKRKLIDYRKDPPQPYATQKVPGNVWEISRVRFQMPEYERHPTQKPIRLLERIIKASSHPGDVVLDPFSGSFTTSFVAQQLGRRSIGIEQEEAYVKIGLRRLGLATHYKGEALAEAPKDQRNKS